MSYSCDHCIDKRVCLTCNPPKVEALLQEPDPELERLLAEEEQIERSTRKTTMTLEKYEEAVDTARHEGVQIGEMRGRRETLIMIHRLVDELTARDISAASQLAAIKALAKQEIWGDS